MSTTNTTSLTEQSGAEREANERTCSVDDAARTIGVGRHGLHYGEALTTATAYAIQLGVDTGVQEGGQAPGVMLTNADYRHIVAAFQAGSEDATEQMREAAERDGERPVPPAWWERSKYPTCEQVNESGDPFRTFERIFDGNADRAWSAYMLVEDTLTAHGVERGDVLIRATTNGDGVTPEQARAMAAALLQAANVAEGAR